MATAARLLVGRDRNRTWPTERLVLRRGGEAFVRTKFVICKMFCEKALDRMAWSCRPAVCPLDNDLPLVCLLGLDFG
jgi:hypothetical protein